VDIYYNALQGAYQVTVSCSAKNRFLTCYLHDCLIGLKEAQKMNIGQRIKNMRLKNNLTQDELALSIGTTKQTIHKYENGIITNIPSSKIEAIANILNTTPNYLMGWTEEESKVHTTLANLRIFFLKQDYNIYEEIMKKANT